MTTLAERTETPRPIDLEPILQPFEAHTRALSFASMLAERDRKAAKDLEELLQLQGCPDRNGVLTDEQAGIIAKMARRFDREGDVAARDNAESALWASGLDIDLVRPHTVAESIQADREGRRMREVRKLLAG